jgi:hypothetical protein
MAFIFTSTIYQPAHTHFARDVYHYQHLYENIGCVAAVEYTGSKHSSSGEMCRGSFHVIPFCGLNVVHLLITHTHKQALCHILRHLWLFTAFLLSLREFHVEFVVNKMAMGKGFLSKYRYFSIYATIVLKIRK